MFSVQHKVEEERKQSNFGSLQPKFNNLATMNDTKEDIIITGVDSGIRKGHVE